MSEHRSSVRHSDHAERFIQHLEQHQQESLTDTPLPPGKLAKDFMNQAVAQSPQHLRQRVVRLLAVCQTYGIDAVLPELETTPELVLPLAEACQRAGMEREATYLAYLDFPFD